MLAGGVLGVAANSGAASSSERSPSRNSSGSRPACDDWFCNSADGLPSGHIFMVFAAFWSGRKIMATGKYENNIKTPTESTKTCCSKHGVFTNLLLA